MSEAINSFFISGSKPSQGSNSILPQSSKNSGAKEKEDVSKFEECLESCVSKENENKEKSLKAKEKDSEKVEMSKKQEGHEKKEKVKEKESKEEGETEVIVSEETEVIVEEAVADTEAALEAEAVLGEGEVEEEVELVDEVEGDEELKAEGEVELDTEGEIETLISTDELEEASQEEGSEETELDLSGIEESDEDTGLIEEAKDEEVEIELEIEEEEETEKNKEVKAEEASEEILEEAQSEVESGIIEEETVEVSEDAAQNNGAVAQGQAEIRDREHRGKNEEASAHGKKIGASSSEKGEQNGKAKGKDHAMQFLRNEKKVPQNGEVSPWDHEFRRQDVGDSEKTEEISSFGTSFAQQELMNNIAQMWRSTDAPPAELDEMIEERTGLKGLDALSSVNQLRTNSWKNGIDPKHMKAEVVRESWLKDVPETISKVLNSANLVLPKRIEIPLKTPAGAHINLYLQETNGHVRAQLSTNDKLVMQWVSREVVFLKEMQFSSDVRWAPPQFEQQQSQQEQLNQESKKQENQNEESDEDSLDELSAFEEAMEEVES